MKQVIKEIQYVMKYRDQQEDNQHEYIESRWRITTHMVNYKIDNRCTHTGYPHKQRGCNRSYTLSRDLPIDNYRRGARPAGAGAARPAGFAAGFDTLAAGLAAGAGAAAAALVRRGAGAGSGSGSGSGSGFSYS